MHGFPHGLLKALVNLVKRRFYILVVKFCRSMYDVLMWRGSGLRMIARCLHPMHFGGLYLFIPLLAGYGPYSFCNWAKSVSWPKTSHGG